MPHGLLDALKLGKRGRDRAAAFRAKPSALEARERGVDLIQLAV